MNPVELSLFASRMEAICDEMGSVLRCSAFSPNIKERLDFSCAVFSSSGKLGAQAAHIPVHLGSMAFAMEQIVSRFDWQAGEVLILNDPFLGGTHLPDVTVLSPVFLDSHLKGFVVNRAHHANIGSESPGSMPNSTSLDEEGIVISPQYLIQKGRLNVRVLPLLEEIQALDEKNELCGDIAAQVSSVQLGVERLGSFIENLGLEAFDRGLHELNLYGERLAQSSLSSIPSGQYRFSDKLDDDGAGTSDIPIRLCLEIRDGQVTVDFTGSSMQVNGNVNCPLPVTAAAVYYVFRCLMPIYTPACSGIFNAITIKTEQGSLLNARYPAAVVAGNVETSSRIVDVVLGALAQALPERIPAASQGTMNNLAMGNREAGSTHWDYYETLAGGIGASPQGCGADAMHSHMTNTLNTPIESLEMHYPLQVLRYCVREGSGGAGAHRGGCGLVREYRFLAEAQVSLLTERRTNQPWGLSGGAEGSRGVNFVNAQPVAGKCALQVKAGDRLRIETPGGGGWGEEVISDVLE